MERLIRARERGASGLEYAGFVTVAALIVGALFLGIFGPSNRLGQAVTSAVCQIITLGQGDCAPPPPAQDAHKPTEPCVVGTSGHTSNIKAGVVVMGSGGDRWLVEQLSDGTFRVTRGRTGGVGAETGVGFSVTATAGAATYGGEATAGAGVGINFSQGEVYNLPNEEAVNNLLQAHFSDLAKDSTVGEPSYDIPFTDWSVPNPVRQIADAATDLAGVENLPEPDETYIDGGVSASASASATFLAANAQAGAGVTGVLGVRQGKDGTTTTYYSAKAELSVKGGTWGGGNDGSYVYAAAEAGGKLDLSIAIERDAEGNVTSVVVTTGATGTAYAGLNPDDSSTRWQQTVELPVDTAANRAVANDFLNAMNMGPVPGLPGYVPNPTVGTSPVNPFELNRTLSAFVSAAAQDGYLTQQTFTTNDANYGANFDAAWIAKIAASANVNTFTTAATSAQYFNGSEWVPWEGCTA